MFRTIRSRLIWSQILPLLIVLPLLGLSITYTVERQFMIPKLANTLLGDARLLSEISSAEYELWGNPFLFNALIERIQLDPAIEVMFLDARGNLLFSSDAEDMSATGQHLDLPGISAARNGEEIALTTYSFFRVKDVRIDVYEPVFDSGLSVIGIVRLSYRVESLYESIGKMRWQIILFILIGLAISLVLGTGLAVSISRPISKITRSIYDLAIGQRHEPLEINGLEELQSQAQTVNFLVEQLHSLEQSRRQLLANLVHELGRPIGSIRSAIHALQTGAEKDDALYRDLTQGLDAESLRMQKLLNDLANLYDQAVGGLELKIQNVEVNRWLAGILSTWQTAAREKGLDWEENIKPDLGSIRMDPDRMAQVVGNLLSNAVKYTRQGGKVTCTVDRADGELVVCIADTGVGIQKDELTRIFQPFFRGEQGRRIKQGMGLGLSIAKDLAEAHGGRLDVESKVAEGSVFTLILPLYKENLSS